MPTENTDLVIQDGVVGPTDDQPVLPGTEMTVDQLCASLERRASALRSSIAAHVRNIKQERTELAADRVELAKTERVLKASKPRGQK